MHFYDTNRLSSHDQYSYVVSPSGVALTRLVDGFVKMFPMAACNIQMMTRHMNSLTDTQLNDFFPKKHKTNQDKKESQ